MSWVCSSTSAMPIAAKPSRFALRKGYGWKPRASRGAVRMAAVSRAPVVVMTSRMPALSAGSRPSSLPSTLIAKGTYALFARPANCPAYATRSLATCSAVCRQLHSSRPALISAQSRSNACRSSATALATASSTSFPPMLSMRRG